MKRTIRSGFRRAFETLMVAGALVGVFGCSQQVDDVGQLSAAAQYTRDSEPEPPPTCLASDSDAEIIRECGGAFEWAECWNPILGKEGFCTPAESSTPGLNATVDGTWTRSYHCLCLVPGIANPVFENNVWTSYPGSTSGGGGSDDGSAQDPEPSDYDPYGYDPYDYPYYDPPADDCFSTGCPDGMTCNAYGDCEESSSTIDYGGGGYDGIIGDSCVDYYDCQTATCCGYVCAEIGCC